MAQTGFTPISNYYSATATNVPTAGNLVAGELAINTADGKLFYKDSAGVVQTMASKDAVSGTFNSVTTNNLTIGTTQLGAGNASIMKNRIINGSFVIDQRNAGASVTPTATNTYTLDRWKFYLSQASKFSTQQNAGSVTPPIGFSNYLGVTSLSAYTVGASENFLLSQVVEGFNTADLQWGTANAKTVTLSFWVRSSLTGTFGGAFGNTAGDRSYPFSYTISSANTWEQKSITVAGDTSGTWGTGNASSIFLYLNLGTGSTLSGTAGAWVAGYIPSVTGATSVVGTNGATFYITGVQLEVGSSATGFEYVNYQTSLANCQRYYQFVGGTANGFPLVQAYTGTLDNRDTPISFPVAMRTTPTGTKNGTWDVSNCGQPLVRFLSPNGFSFGVVPTSASANYYAFPNSTDDTLTFSAEL